MATKKKRLSEELWAELKGLYESGTYSFRQLVDYTKSRGFVVSAQTIQRRSAVEGWIKGSVVEEIRESIVKESKEKIGKAILDMLALHKQQSNALMAEAMRTLANAEKKRTKADDYVLPAATLVSITNVLGKAQEMQARALGWDLKEGKPLGKDDNKPTEDTTVLAVEVMSDQEEADLKNRAVSSEEFED